MKLATLLYIKNSKEEYLLIERLRQPNRGYMSPPGGKLDIQDVETPLACAIREAEEECGIKSGYDDWTFLGIIAEKNYPEIGDIMIFAFLYNKPIEELPPPCPEGKFAFIHPSDFQKANIPDTDKLYIWKFVLENTNSIFSIRIDCTKRDKFNCRIERK